MKRGPSGPLFCSPGLGGPAPSPPRYILAAADEVVPDRLRDGLPGDDPLPGAHDLAPLGEEVGPSRVVQVEILVVTLEGALLRQERDPGQVLVREVVKVAVPGLHVERRGPPLGALALVVREHDLPAAGGTPRDGRFVVLRHVDADRTRRAIHAYTS